MLEQRETSLSLPVGVVIRRSAGVTRWSKWVWRAVAIVPGAPHSDWKELRSTETHTDFYATTMALELHRSDTEAYRIALSENPPCVFVVMRDGEADAPLDILMVTASPYEGQDYADSGEEIVEKVAMPDGMIAWIQEFVEKHHEDEVFVKRKRDKKRIDLVEDGVGDHRIRQTSDVYRAPVRNRKEVLQ